MTRLSWSIPCDGVTVYRRRARLVVWSLDGVTTAEPFDLYWCPSQGCTFARLSVLDGCGVWLRMQDLIGHWEFYTDKIAGLRVLDGYGDSGKPMPMCEQIWPTQKLDVDNGARYWISDRKHYLPNLYREMVHT